MKTKGVQVASCHVELSHVGEQELKVVFVVPLHHADKTAFWSKGALEDSLQKTVGCNLDSNGINGHMLERLLEENGADQVVYMVVRRRVLGQLSAPTSFWDRRADPAACPWTFLFYHLNFVFTFFYTYQLKIPSAKLLSRQVQLRP